MATVDKAFRIKNGLVVEGSTATVNGHDVLTKAIADAKGDLLVGTADNAISRLAAGTNGYVLTADSAETTGLKWAAAPAVGSFETSIVFEGATADSYETTLTVTDPTADRTITLPNVSGTVITTGDSGTVTSTMIENGTIVDGDISASAAIGASKIAGTAVTQADSGTVTSTMIANDTIVDADINSAAAIAQSKIANLTTDLGNKASSSDLTTHTGATEAHGATGAVVGTTNTQTLTNKTLTTPTINGPTITDTGQTPTIHGIYLPAPHTIIFEGTTANDFETTLAAGDPTGDRTVTLPDATGTVALTNNKLDAFAATSSAELAGVISDETGTGALVFANTPTLVTPNIGAATGTSLVLSGDLTVNGTTTTINSTEITIDDKNLVLGSVATPSDAGADGGGITLKGATDKTINWVDATDSWTFSEHVNLASGKEFKVNGTSLKDATETLTNKSISGSSNTLSNIANSSLTNSAITINGTSTSLGGSRTLGSDDIAEGSTNKYFTDERAQDAVGTTLGTGLSYNDTTGAISNSGVLSITGTSNQVVADVSTGAVTLSLPQSIHTAASPTFAALSVGTGALTAGSLTLTDALIGTATQALSNGSATVVDSWSASTYSSAKYIVQMKKGNDIEVLEVLVTVNGENNVYLTEYADVQSNAEIGTTDADYSGGNVRLKVTASDGTTVKVHKTLIEA